jgi:hypothetical protein
MCDKRTAYRFAQVHADELSDRNNRFEKPMGGGDYGAAAGAALAAGAAIYAQGDAVNEQTKAPRLLLWPGAARTASCRIPDLVALSSRPKDAGETVLFQANDIVEIQSSFAAKSRCLRR